MSFVGSVDTSGGSESTQEALALVFFTDQKIHRSGAL